MAGMSYVQRLRHWALKTNQSHKSVSWILDIIRSGPAPENLPRSAKTLLKTSKTATAKILGIPGGKYWYKGIANSLSHVLKDLHVPNSISLNMNVDGISVFRSSSTQFWPILVSIHEMPKISLMPVAIFCGSKKPRCSASFLDPLVAEIKGMAENGVWLNGNRLNVSVRAFICDSPARAFIKGNYRRTIME
uniref:Uncharacterized protein n=1 Tax=Anopheles atroparvus TaxID=41427 RepID=A0AAG5DRH2_ANOAO